jgi:alkaline phosphatase D
MTQTVATGSLLTSSTVDYTVKVDVTGLESATMYYYEFTALNANSQRGRTKTTPVNMKDSLRFAVVSVRITKRVTSMLTELSQIEMTLML